MPRREDESYIRQKEATGKPLCPFDGSPDVYYNKHYKVWRCAKCERSFPSPSYGGRGKVSWWRRLFRRSY